MLTTRGMPGLPRPLKRSLGLTVTTVASGRSVPGLALGVGGEKQTLQSEVDGWPGL